MVTNAAKILREVAKRAFADPKVVQKAWKHTKEVRAQNDQAANSGYYGLPPEPGSWGGN